MVSKYQRDVALLSELETFDPKAFVGDAIWPQNICNFILALALAYNDFKNVVFAVTMLGPVRLVDLAKPTPELGHFAGMQHHLVRTTAGILRAVMELIEKNDAVLVDLKFKDLVRNLPSEARESWHEVVAAAQHKPSSSPLAMLLVRARNKVVFHYDPEELGRGYAYAFLSPSTMEPFISRGESMAAARFHFADAAAEVYLRNVTDAATVEEFFQAASPLLNQANHSLRELVTRFVNMRGFGFRKPNRLPPSRDHR